MAVRIAHKLFDTRRGCVQISHFRMEALSNEMSSSSLYSDHQPQCVRELAGGWVNCALTICTFEVETSSAPPGVRGSCAHDRNNHACYHIQRMRLGTLQPLGCCVDARPTEIINTTDLVILLHSKPPAQWKVFWYLRNLHRTFGLTS